MNTNHPSSKGAGAESAAALESALSAEKEARLRLAADFDNFRKRSAQEAERRAAVQKEGFIRDLLPIVDNLERALGARGAASSEQLERGVELTLLQLHTLLRQHGIEPEESAGQQFDPERHEALRIGHDPRLPHHAILEVFERGYRRGDQMFRPARVVVNDLNENATNGHGG